MIHLVAYPSECSPAFNELYELCKGGGGWREGRERERERERERGEKGRDPGGLMIVDCVMSPYFFHDHCNQ